MWARLCSSINTGVLHRAQFLHFAFSEKGVTLKFVFRLAAVLAAGSILAACSGGMQNTVLPRTQNAMPRTDTSHVGSSLHAYCPGHDTITCGSGMLPTPSGLTTSKTNGHDRHAQFAVVVGGWGCPDGLLDIGSATVNGVTTTTCEDTSSGGDSGSSTGSGSVVCGITNPVTGQSGCGNTCIVTSTGYSTCGTKVALIPPAPGDPCDGSQLTLGSQWPVNTTDKADEVVNIDALQANNANGVPEIAGWEYVMGNGTAYIQGNAGFKTFWTGLAESIPVLGPLIANLDSGGIVPVSSNEAGQILNYISGHSGKSGSCFTSSLG